MDLKSLKRHLDDMGLERGSVLMVHSSFKAIGIKDPEMVIRALELTLGEEGTLMMPALSYDQDPSNIYSSQATPSCVGFLAEYFRCRKGTKRSIHPTHSVCAVGKDVDFFLNDHSKDNTPCGPNSPFNKILLNGGTILMLGCGLRPNTTMHAIEEHVVPSYLFGPSQVYTITGVDGITYQKAYIAHDFKGFVQRYDRVLDILFYPHMRIGRVGNAASYLISCKKLFEVAVKEMEADSFFFVDKCSGSSSAILL
jgi:aminoglycoside 3-N-acetyltransferase